MVPSALSTMIHMLRKTSTQCADLMGFVHRERHYVVGFRSRHDAIRVKQSVCTPKPDVHVQHSRILDVTDAVNEGLSEMGVRDTKVQRVVIDPEAVLSFPKHHRRWVQDDDELETFAVDAQEFMMYPFEKHLGIAMPYELVNDWGDPPFEGPRNTPDKLVDGVAGGDRL